MTIRDEVRGMADNVGLGELALDVAVVITELVANALEHGNPPVSVAVSWNGHLSIEVTDAGSVPVDADPAAWGAVPPDHGAERGRGVWIVRQLMDTFDVRHGARGTRVRATLTPEYAGEGTR